MLRTSIHALRATSQSSRWTLMGKQSRLSSTHATLRLNPLVTKLSGPSATLRINELSNKMQAEGKTVHKLGLGQSPFPVPASVQESLRQNAHQKDYLPVKGLLPLREALVTWYQAQYGLENLDPENVMVGPGTKQLLFLIQVCVCVCVCV
jgi:aspartate aminotransferase